MPDAADAPSIPRYTSHGRKRSMTGPRIPPAPATLRNFTAPNVNVPPCANYSIGSGPGSVGDFGFGGLSQPASLYGKNSNPSNPASPRPSDVTNDSNGPKQFVDTAGTMRMEAFVAARRSNDTSTNGSAYAPSRMRAGIGIGGRARGNTQWSSSTSDPRRSGMIVMDEFDAFDPFKGF